MRGGGGGRNPVSRVEHALRVLKHGPWQLLIREILHADVLNTDSAGVQHAVTVI